MVQKLLFSSKFTIAFYLNLILFLVFTIETKAQCAGTDNAITVCDITNVASQNIDLNALLGTHTSGGSWNDDNKSGGLNATTGFLNVQLIKKSGVYHYTYTVNGVSGCTDNNAKITVTVGGYAGVPAPNASICSAEITYNLFQVFQGTPTLSPQTGGTWNDDDSSGGLNTTTGILNASVPIPDDNYAYTYSIPAIDVCPAVSTQVFVSIYRSPRSGIPSDLKLCSNQLSAYTNFDLNNLLSGEDANGSWSEVGTTEISGETDSSINIQNIYNTKGPGIYYFAYTVISDNAVCKNQTATVRIIIEKQLDFTGSTLTVNSDKCENEISTATYNAVLTQGPQSIPDGTYDVTYSISGIATSFTTRQPFSGGVLSFPIPLSNFQQAQDYTIRIIEIKDINSQGLCNTILGTIEDVLHIYSLPRINNATLTIVPICQNFDALVDFSGTSNLSDGSYIVVYNIGGANTGTALTAVLNISGGLGSFIVPKSVIPNVGRNSITITKITNSTTGCTNTSTLNQSFTINPLPDATNITATINNMCQGQAANVKLSGLGALTSISIDYSLSGANSFESQTVSLTAVGGVANFTIPANILSNAGQTSFTITNLTNTITGCSSIIDKNTDFTVNSIPSTPVANDQSFCTSDNAKVSNLIPQGNQYQWFDSATSTPLSSTTTLISGKYFVKEVNTIGCESPLKEINVLINATPQINNATLTVSNICQGNAATVNFSGNSNLADGNYNILYNLTGGNTATGVSATLNSTAGLASFTISSNLIPNSGSTTITITNITNNSNLCTNTSTLSKSFTVNAIPNISNMGVTVNNVCLGQAANITITGLGTLTNITMTYTVSGANTIGSQTIPLVVATGNASFTIPAANLLNAGGNTLVITNITDAVNGCSSVVNSVSKNFTISVLPNSPSASNQKFCETDLATVAKLVPSGSQYKWYDTATSTTPLSADKLLVTKNYYVKETNSATSCESLPTTVNVQINTVPIPVLNTNGNEFCGINKPTIINLSNNTTASSNLVWYDAAANGTILPNQHLLEEGLMYYGFDYDTTTKCYSSPLSVTVSLTNCTVTPEGLKIPDGFSPNGDGVNDTFQIADIEFSFPNYTLEIFNRYGNVMFKGDNNKPAWDGKNTNSSFVSGDAPAGVYFYIIHYNKDNLPPKQGQLYLNR